MYLLCCFCRAGTFSQVTPSSFLQGSLPRSVRPHWTAASDPSRSQYCDSDCLAAIKYSTRILARPVICIPTPKTPKQSQSPSLLPFCPSTDCLAGCKLLLVCAADTLPLLLIALQKKIPAICHSSRLSHILHTVISSPPCLCGLSTHAPVAVLRPPRASQPATLTPLYRNTTPIGIHDLGCDASWSAIPSRCLAQTASRWWPDSVPRTRLNWSRAASPSSPSMARILVPST